jgi:hypothetical protein
MNVLLASIGDWIGKHSWGVGLAAVAVAFLPAILEHKSLWKKQKETKGTERTWTLFKWVIVWLVPLIPLLAWYASDRASDAAETRRTNDIAALKIELPRKLYSGMTSEMFSASDTNRFIWRKTAAGSWKVCMILKAAAIPGSLIGSIQSSSAMSNKSLIGQNTTRKNVFLKEFWGDWWDFNGMVFHIQYAADNQETNLVNHIELPDDNVILADGGGL